MPKQSYALEVGGEKRLEISWKGTLQNVNIKLDGNLLGTIANQTELMVGQQFPLADGTTLKIQLVKKFLATELQILRNGEPLPGTASDPHAKLKNAYGIIYFLGGFNIILGLVAILFKVSALLNFGIGIFSIIYGLILLVLGFFTQAKSNIALILAIIILALDVILAVVFTVSIGRTPNITGILLRIFFIIPLIRGIDAINILNKKQQ